MAAARAGDEDIGPARQEGDLELLAGRGGVEADLGEGDRRGGQGGNVALEEPPDDRSVLLSDGAILDVGVDLGPGVPRDLHAETLELGHAVVDVFLGGG